MSPNKTLTTPDGIALDAEITLPRDPADTEAGFCFCHPHPQHGGNMRSIVISALWKTLPHLGYAGMRFNFRGVEGSAGSFDEGRGELIDAQTALSVFREELGPITPIFLVGWSFGGGIALSVKDHTHSGWIAIAPSLKYAQDISHLTLDSRKKLVILAENDATVENADVYSKSQAWPNTKIEIVAGADHFFVGKTDRLVQIVANFADNLRDK